MYAGLQIRALSRGYGAYPVLTDLSLPLPPPGTRVAVGGANAAGKPARLKAIGVQRPAQG